MTNLIADPKIAHAEAQRDAWATDTEYDVLFNCTTHSATRKTGVFETVLAHTFHGDEDLGRDVTIRWDSYDANGKACTREEFAVTEHDLDGLIETLHAAKARLKGVAA